MNMKDIAKELGISVATVSRAINNSDNINPETKKKVLEFVEKSGYTPNAIARNLSKMESRTIALLIPNISNPFFASLVEEICKAFSKTQYQIALYNTSEDLEQEKKAIKNILGERIAGVIAVLIKGTYDNNPFESLINHNIPVLLLDRDTTSFELPGVFLDNFNGAYKVVKRLLEKGHRKISILTGDLNSITSQERLRGYIKAHEDMEIPYSKEDIYEGDFLVDSGYTLGKEILKTSSTALFSSNNLMLLGFLKAAREIKKDIDLACFEELNFLNIFDIEVLACKIPLNIMGEKVFELFFTDKNKRKKIYIEPILKEGDE